MSVPAAWRSSASPRPGAAQRDLLALAERQTPAFEIAATTRADPAFGGDPPPAHLAIGPGLLRRTRDELPACNAAQNGCTTSGRIRQLNAAIYDASNPHGRTKTGASSEARRTRSPSSAPKLYEPARRRPRPRPPVSRQPCQPTEKARVAITARTQGTLSERGGHPPAPPFGLPLRLLERVCDGSEFSRALLVQRGRDPRDRLGACSVTRAAAPG